MNLDYIASAYQKIDNILERAKRKNIDLSQKYPENSREWRLQVDLDHVGADLNMDFGGVSEERYQQFDGCLKHLEGIFEKGHFFERMEERRNEIKKRHEDNKRVKKLAACLVGCSEDEVDELFYQS